jgi:hypothetical protein
MDAINENISNVTDVWHNMAEIAQYTQLAAAYLINISNSVGQGIQQNQITSIQIEYYNYSF